MRLTYRTFLQNNRHPDARFFLLGVKDWTLSELLVHLDDEIDEKEKKDLFTGIARLEEKEPLQYVLKKAPFYGREFYVDPRVLIPRFDTEILVNQVLEAIPAGGEEAILDLCTGSGCIGLTIAMERPGSKVVLSDLSDGALQVAKKNRERFGLDVRILKSDLFSRIKGRFSVIVSNPPYIPDPVIDTLSDEVKKEPRIALSGGRDGLDFYRRIAKEAGSFLCPGGKLFLEIGYDEGESVSLLLEDAGFSSVHVVTDLGNLDRVITACWNNLKN